MRTSEREVEELKTSNNYLLEKLELWSMSHSSSPTMKNSLMSELELSTSESETSLQRRLELTERRVEHTYWSRSV